MKREHPRRAPRPRAPIGSAVASVASAMIGWASAPWASAQVTTPPSSGDRVLGLDVSAWQGDIGMGTWTGLHTTDHRDFVFIRSSRGGTTGYYNQNNSGNNNPPGQNTLSQRYDDPYFMQNITLATNAGLLAGPYHFGRMDIIESTLNSNGIRNNGTDEANHFIEMAGAWMRPGYLLPTFDFEAGASQRTASELAQFAIDFSNRIYAVKGIRPMVYIGANYASPMNSIAESPAVVAAMPNLWSARWPNQANPNSINTQGTDPGDYTSTVYGPWDNSPYGSADPWHFWQYASTGGLVTFGGNSLDVDVAHGNIEYLKDHQVPALWVTAGDGQWTTMTNWNSGETPVEPVQGPGQVARVGPLTLPATRLPGPNDNVDLNRPNDNVTVTLSSGAQSVRRININERLNVTGGSLTASLTGQVGAGGTLSISGGGTVTFTQGYVNNGGVLDFAGGGTLNVGTLFLSSNATFTGASGTGQILPKAGVATPLIDLGAGTRTLTIGDGSASTDLLVAIPLSNGNLTKDGAGTLELTGNNSAYTGTLTIANGYMLLSAANQLGTTGVKTTQTSQTVGGSVRVSGNGLNITAPINTGGLGFNNSGGALENVSGSNTWSGPVLLGGLNSNQGQTGLNQIGAATGTTLTISGVISNATTSATWAKVGGGDVVLSGASANTYSGLTRLFDGRLIVEKNGALGSAGAPDAATANTFQLGSASTLAFRSPAAGFNYTAFEVINTDGTGAPGGFGQVDNLAGTNTFGGIIAFGGPTVAGVIASTIGVFSGSLDVQGGLYARGTTGTRAITKLGSGTLIVSGASGDPTANPSVVPLTNTAFTIDAGTIDLRGATPATQLLPGVTTWNVTDNATLTTTTGTLAGTSVNVATGGTMNFNGGATNLAALNVAGGNVAVSAGGSKTLRAAALSITAGGKVDLSDSDAIIDYSGASPLDAVTGYIQSGRNGGSWNGAAGLTTSQPDGAAGLTALGVAEATQALRIAATQTGVWNSQSVDGTSVLVMYTYAGDATLDGKIDVDDYGRIDLNLNTDVSGWFNGDFNYDGKINVDDYGIIDFNLAVQGPPLSSGSSTLSSLSAVPEPSTLLILALPLLPLGGRKRKAPRR